MIFTILFELFFFSVVNAAEIDLFIYDRKELQRILNTQKESSALKAFINNSHLTTQYKKNTLPKKNYFYFDLQRKKESISFTESNNEVLVKLGRKLCRFPLSAIKLDNNPNNNLSLLVMDSDQCRIKGYYIKDLNRVTTLIIHVKEYKKYIVTGSLIEER